MHLVSKFRLYPDDDQENKLFDQMNIHSNIYNRTLDILDQNESWISKYDMFTNLTSWKKEPDNRFDEVNSKAAQETVSRVYDAISSLSSRKQNGYNVGKLRHRNTFTSIEYNQSGFDVRENELRLHPVGLVDMVKHREPSGAIKGVTVKYTRSNEWYACVIHEVEEKSQVSVSEVEDNNVVGIDLNVSNLLTDSDGLKLESLWSYLSDQMDRVRKEQQKLSRKEPGSNNYKKQHVRLSKAYETLFRKRDDILHKLSRWYVDTYDMIALEDIESESLSQGDVKYIKEQAWSKFIEYVSYKASQAGTIVEKVDAHYTSQECSDCGTRVKKTLDERTHECPGCGLEIDRDLNAAINVEQRSRDNIGMGQAESTPPEITSSGGSVPLRWVVEQGSPLL